ncbi:LPXTG cell wall anchor domain-containing protein [Streptococcus suis]|uniref:LPXTG cell wall anchor domain-containing protein n=1 Tax=Streptococcus suis TaxID=1307 RepID=UPI0021BC2A84|nr:LPXTG cell wall anchor domain-containing protein [Streptococcus suis]
MSKQKVVSSLLLSTVVLGGLAFYPTTTVKAEVLEPDVTSVNASDATNIPVVSNEEELEDDIASEEELNEQAEEVTKPSSPEALLQPRAMMSDSTNSDMEEIPVNDEPSDNMAEKVVEKPLIQSSNADSKLSSNDQTKLKTSVSVDSLSLEKKEVKWRVSFDTSAWSFNNSHGGFYFVLPEGLELTEIIDNNHDNSNIIGKFPTNVHSPENNGGKEYRFFSKEKDNDSFNAQWGWSAGQANPDDTVNKWKSENRFSKIYFIDQIKDTTKVTYTLTANVIDPNPKSFLLVAVMKSFGYKNHSNTEYTSLGAREITLEKEKTLPPKEDPKPEEPKQEAPQTPAPDAPQPEGSKDTPEASPKPEAPQTPPAPEASQPEAPESSGIVELGTIPKESLKVKVTFKEKGDILTTADSTYRLQEGQYLEEVIIGSNIEDTLARAQKRVTTKEGYEFVGWALESAPEKEIEKNLKVSHDITLVAIVRKKSSEETLKPMEPKVEKPTPEVPQVPEAPQTPEAPTEEPKKEDAPAPSTPSVPEEQPKETPAPEVPSTPEKQPEAPKEEPEQDAPQTPEAPSTPKEEAPKEEVPAPEVPSIPEEQPKETPVPEVPKQKEVQPEAPKSDKVETDKPMPETKKPDMKQPKTDDMPKEQKPKAEEPKAEQPQMEAPKKDSEAPKTGKTETDKPMPETKKPDMKQPKTDDMPKEQKPKAEEPKAEQPQMEAPKKDSEAPKTGKTETDKPMPETKKPDMKQPKTDDMPKEQKPKAEEPKAEQPQMEAPKKDSEAPKTGKTETDKPMPETKKPDMKQPKTDDMPKEQKPKAEEPKAEQPQMEAPKKDSEAPKTGKTETDKPMPETKKPDMKQPKTDDMPKEQKPKAEEPKAEAPKATLPNTGEASSAIGWLGGALATLATGLYLFKNKKEE